MSWAYIASFYQILEDGSTVPKHVAALIIFCELYFIK
jgi:hypothetical protein